MRRPTSVTTNVGSQEVDQKGANHQGATGYYEDPRQEMLAFIPSHVRVVLDVGCGAGAFGQIVKQHRAAQVWGVEKITEAASRAGDVLDRVLTGEIEECAAQLPAEYFDCVICNDVLEHLIDPWKVLQILRMKLAPGGRVVASIPNIRYYPYIKELLFDGNWRYRDCGILDITHLRFFTLNSMKDLFDRTGYNIERLEGIRTGKMSWKFDLLNGLVSSKFDDMRYERFAIVAMRKA